MLRDVAARRLDQLDGLPGDLGERIRGLQDYDFLEPPRAGALRRAREEAPGPGARPVRVGHVGGHPVDEPGRPGREPRDGPRPQRADPRADRGGDPDATDFLKKHGRFFPGAQTFDDIIDQLAQRMAAMQSLMRSMSPEQRAELQSMMEALLRDDRLLLDLAQLASNLDLLLPGGLGDRVPFGGDEPLGLEGALAQIARLQALDRLEDALSDVGSPGDLASIDRDEVSDLLARTPAGNWTPSTISPGGSRRRDI